MVNRFDESVLLIVQYRYLKSCSGNLILQNLILCTRSCVIGFITQYGLVFHFQLTESVRWKWFVWAVYQFRKGMSAGPALKYFTWFIGAGRFIDWKGLWSTPRLQGGGHSLMRYGVAKYRVSEQEDMGGHVSVLWMNCLFKHEHFLRNCLTLHTIFTTLRGCSKDGTKRLLCFSSTMEKHGQMNTRLEHV